MVVSTSVYEYSLQISTSLQRNEVSHELESQLNMVNKAKSESHCEDIFREKVAEQ